MAHYAKIDSNNIVVAVHAVNDSDENGSEENGIAFLTTVHGDISPHYWKKTSYGSSAGKHYLFDENGNRSENPDQSKTFRKNYAGIGFTYDVSRDAFIPPRAEKCNGAIIHVSWTLNEETCCWDTPTTWPHETHPNNNDHEGFAMNPSWDEHKLRIVGQKENGGVAEGQPRPSDDQVQMYIWDPSSGTWSDGGFTFAQFLDMNYTGDF
mgnify:FL=1|tara:strand:- start:25 stop:648 length:624 start_codon:yes stop_codon:yes gene_type:complete